MGKEPKKGMPLPIPGHSLLLLIGQNLVTWSYLAAREVGNVIFQLSSHQAQQKPMGMSPSLQVPKRRVPVPASS